MVSTRTVLKEEYLKTIEDYGLFVDIFEYHNISNNYFMQKVHFDMIKLKKMFINGYFYERIPENSNYPLLRKFREWISNRLGIKRILKIYNKEINKYSKKENSQYVMSNWPTYKMNSEIQQRKYLDDYIDVEFDGIKVMVTKHYDELLTNIFGNYMELPPESKRVAHSLRAYWRK